MDDQSPTDIAQRGMRYAQDNFAEWMTQTEDYVREKPTQSLLYAMAAGYVLNVLGVFRILGGALRLFTFLLKPALLIYGATKVYEMMRQDQPT